MIRPTAAPVSPPASSAASATRAASTPATTRRQFCAQACRAASLLAVAGVAAGCGDDSPTSPSGGTAPPLPLVTGSVTGRLVTVTIAAGSPLTAIGSAALIQTTIGGFLATRTSDTAFNVFSAVCTHQSCTINGFASARFVCPCHGSKFTTAGVVAEGPATRSLVQYPAQFAAGALVFGA